LGHLGLAHWRIGALAHWRIGALAHWRIGALMVRRKDITDQINWLLIR
jgi:hypothetical protein